MDAVSIWFEHSIHDEKEDEGLPELPVDIDGDSVDYEIAIGNSFGTVTDFFGNSASLPIAKGALIFNPNDHYWYQAMYDSWINSADFNQNAVRPDLFRKLDSVFDGDIDKNVLYVKGDIIRVTVPGYEGIYECIVDRVQYYGYPNEVISNWKRMPDDTKQKLVSIVNDEVFSGSYGTVYAKLEADLKRPDFKYRGEYNSSIVYDVGDMVKITIKAAEGYDCVTYYRKVYDYDAQPGQESSNHRLAWKIYNRSFCSYSAYEIGDRIWVYWGSEGKELEFIKQYDCIVSSDSANWFFYNSYQSHYGYTRIPDE